MCSSDETNGLGLDGEGEIRLTVRVGKNMLACLDRWVDEKRKKGRRSDRSDQIRLSIAMRKLAEMRKEREG